MRVSALHPLQSSLSPRGGGASLFPTSVPRPVGGEADFLAVCVASVLENLLIAARQLVPGKVKVPFTLMGLSLVTEREVNHLLTFWPRVDHAKRCAERQM